MARGFAKARELSGITWEKEPPSFHELRSLSARLYTEEKGTEFAQRLLGHKSLVMTAKYQDNRGSEWVKSPPDYDLILTNNDLCILTN